MAELNKPSLIKDDKEEAPVQESAPVEEKAPEREEVYAPLFPGEDLAAFAARWNTTVEKVVERNKLNPDYVHPNQWFFV